MDFLNNLKETIGNIFNSAVEQLNSLTSYTIPEKYNNFPQYPGTIIQSPLERDTNSYCRVALRYSGKPKDEFISTLLQNGFIKGSNVRYDKDNTYVIVDDLDNITEIVYHIKK